MARAEGDHWASVERCIFILAPPLVPQKLSWEMLFIKVCAGKGHNRPQSSAKAGLQVQNPVCVETSCETRQDRSWMDKSNGRWGQCDAYPLQQDLKSQSAPLTGCETPWKLGLSS